MIFFALIYLSFISLGLPDSLLGSLWPIMNMDFGVPVGNAGYISAIISSGTILSSLFSHHIIRRFGTGIVTVVSVAMTAAALMGFSLTPSFLWLLALAVPLGLGAGAVDSGLNEFVAEHYSAKHMNWLHCFWGVGAMLGPILTSALLQSGHSWRSGYLSIAIIQFSLAVLLLFSLPMWRKHQNQSASKQEKSPAGSVKQGLFSPSLAKRAVFAMLTFFLYSTIESSMNLWGASYLVKIKGILPEIATGWISLFFGGITVGRALSGFVSIKLNNEKLIRFGSILMIIGFTVMLLPIPNRFIMFAFMLIGLGLAPIFPSMLHQTPVYFGKENAQATMGFQMACAYTGATLMPPLFGQLFSHISFYLMPYVLLTCGAGLLFCTICLSVAAKKTEKAAICK